MLLLQHGSSLNESNRRHQTKMSTSSITDTDHIPWNSPGVTPSTFDSNAFRFCFQVRRKRFPGMPVFQWHWSPQLLLLAGAKRRVIWASDYVRLVKIATCLKNFLFTLSDCDSYGNFNLKRFYYNSPHSGGTFCIWANWADEKKFIQMYTQHMNVFVNGIELTEPFSCHAIRSLAVLFVFGVFFSAI